MKSVEREDLLPAHERLSRPNNIDKSMRRSRKSIGDLTVMTA